MKFVAMRFFGILAALLVLSSCSGKVVTDQVEKGCAVYTSVKSMVVGAIASTEGLFYGGEEGEGNPDEVQKPVTKQLKYKNQEGVVEVVMKVDEKGNWKVVNMAATNEELAKYVLTKLKDYNQTSHKAVGQVVKYRFVFKKQV
jgi:hypothetical protein